MRPLPMSLTTVTFPRDDTAFAAFVRATMAKLGPDEREDAAAVQAALRRWHTRALVRPQDPMASFGGTTWYIYRDGTAGVRLEQEWWQAEGVATARLGEDEVFVDGDDEACRLVDHPPGGLTGVPWRELVPVEARRHRRRVAVRPAQGRQRPSNRPSTTRAPMAPAG